MAWIQFFILLTIQLMLVEVESSVRIETRMHQYEVNNRDFGGECCDGVWGLCRDNCDIYIKFCFDQLSGSSNYDDCSYVKAQTGEYTNKKVVTFDENMKGVQNPIAFQMPQWPGGFKLKVQVWDDDSYNSNDKVDELKNKFEVRPARSVQEATEIHHVIVGTRSSNPSSLSLYLKVYCEQNYFGPKCDVECIPRNDQYGHYTCDPDTGNIVCLRGWEGSRCTIFSDDCLHAACQNDAVCVDGDQRYDCKCAPGYEGTHCEMEINECLINHCQNSGTCIDQLAKYECICPSNWVGTHCEHHVCQVSVVCQNGGTCYENGQCLCLPGYTGEFCEVNLCGSGAMECYNGGTCSNGECQCPQGFVGLHCDVDVCEHKPCHNGGTCEVGLCICARGYTGEYCEIQIDNCVNSTCLNNAVCVNLVADYKCNCQPGYEGIDCEAKLSDGQEAPIQSEEELSRTLTERDSKNFQPLLIGLTLATVGLLFIVLVLVTVIRRRNRFRKSETNDVQHSIQNPLYDTGTNNVNNPPATRDNALDEPVGDSTEHPYASIDGLSRSERAKQKEAEANGGYLNPAMAFDDVRCQSSSPPPAYSPSDPAPPYGMDDHHYSVPISHNYNTPVQASSASPPPLPRRQNEDNQHYDTPPKATDLYDQPRSNKLKFDDPIYATVSEDA